MTIVTIADENCKDATTVGRSCWLLLNSFRTVEQEQQRFNVIYLDYRNTKLKAKINNVLTRLYKFNNNNSAEVKVGAGPPNTPPTTPRLPFSIKHYEIK